jgi:hypothetical protein
MKISRIRSQILEMPQADPLANTPEDTSAARPIVILRLAPDDGMAGDPGSPGQPQGCPAVDGAGGSLSAAEHEQAGTREQGLSLFARWAASTRSGAPTSPTSRWPGAFFTWWSSWIG